MPFTARSARAVSSTPSRTRLFVAEIKFGYVAMKVSIAAMLIDTLHAALEHTVEAFKSVGVNIATHVLAHAVTHEVVFGEVLPKVRILSGFVSHHMTAAIHVGLDDRQKVGRSGTGNVKGNVPSRLPGAVQSGHHRVLVGIAATNGHVCLVCR